MQLLVADDDPATLTLLQRSLIDWGYEVIAVSDGAAAWEVLRGRDAPQLALLDWMMPGFDGTEVCRRVREESAASFVYLILLTSKHEVTDVVRGIESGADDYVTKPFDAQELKVRLRAGHRIVEFHQRLLDQAARDALTGVWNRRTILEVLDRELATARRRRRRSDHGRHRSL
jgi:two-component system, cell cycle response regulator